MDETRVEFLTANHERGTFDCGKPPLNAFIRQHAAVNQERGVSRVYVAVRGPHQCQWENGVSSSFEWEKRCQFFFRRPRYSERRLEVGMGDLRAPPE